jgi:hypothetical protein
MRGVSLVPPLKLNLATPELEEVKGETQNILVMASDGSKPSSIQAS